MGCSSHHSGNRDLVFGVYVCQHCDATTVTLDATPPKCHSDRMKGLGTPDTPVTRSALSSLLNDAFGIPRTSSELCFTLVSGGLCGTTGLADLIEGDLQTVETQLKRLESSGLLTSTALNREDGGNIDVYHTTEPPKTLEAFCRWAIRAAGDSPSEYTFDQAVGGPAAVFRDTFCKENDDCSLCP